MNTSTEKLADGVLIAGRFIDNIRQRLQETGADLGDTPDWLERWLDDLQGETRHGFLQSLSTFIALAASGAVIVPGADLVAEVMQASAPC